MHRIACTERVLLIFPEKNYGEGYEYECRNMTASVEISINFTLNWWIRNCVYRIWICGMWMDIPYYFRWKLKYRFRTQGFTVATTRFPRNSVHVRVWEWKSVTDTHAIYIHLFPNSYYDYPLSQSLFEFYWSQHSAVKSQHTPTQAHRSMPIIETFYLEPQKITQSFPFKCRFRFWKG